MIVLLVAFLLLYKESASLSTSFRRIHRKIQRNALYSENNNKLEGWSSSSPTTLLKYTTKSIQPSLFSLIGAQCIITYLPNIAIAVTDPEVKDIPVVYDGVSSPLSAYLGSKCTLIINVASQCALTPQYEELVELYDLYHQAGFNILAFPCNQFGSQEPAPVQKIRKDMKVAFGVQFPIFDKIDVNGPNASPLYVKLKSYKDIGVSNINKISWNFEKFLLGSDGTPLRRYKPGIRPAELSTDIKSLISSGVISPKQRATLIEY